jgi:hypothetical protein
VLASLSEALQEKKYVYSFYPVLLAAVSYYLPF